MTTLCLCELTEADLRILARPETRMDAVARPVDLTLTHRAARARSGSAAEADPVDNACLDSAALQPAFGSLS